MFGLREKKNLRLVKEKQLEKAEGKNNNDVDCTVFIYIKLRSYEVSLIQCTKDERIRVVFRKI